MENIYIEGSNDVYFVPTVNFDATKGYCEIAGESFLAETVKFYTPLINWLEDYAAQKIGPLEFVFKLSYFNTSSSKCILDLLKVMKKYQDNGGKVQVYWHYDIDDTDMQDALEDYIIDTGVPIKLMPIKD